MNRVFATTEQSFFAQGNLVAVYLSGEGQLHSGILLRDEEIEDAVLLHLCWHCKLTLNAPPSQYLWILPCINTRRSRQLAIYCRRLWRTNDRNVPYAFSCPNDIFDKESGKFLLGKTKYGLTCSSFVLAVFLAQGIQLIDGTEWPRRLGDIEWQKQILTMLKEHAAPEHIASVESEIGAVRYRPEEVAGAAALAPPAATFTAIQPVSEQIKNKLMSL